MAYSFKDYIKKIFKENFFVKPIFVLFVVNKYLRLIINRAQQCSVAPIFFLLVMFWQMYRELKYVFNIEFREISIMVYICVLLVVFSTETFT